MNTKFYTGNELQKLQPSQANFWMIYVANGEVDFVSGDNMCHAPTGCVVIVGTTSSDVQLFSDKNYTAYTLAVKDENACDLVNQHLRMMNLADTAMCAIPAGRQQSNILAVFQNLVAQNGNLDASLKLLQELKVRLYRASLKIVAGIHNNRMDLVTDLQERLKNHYGEDVTLESLATTYQISISYLSHVFKAATGIPIMRYLLCRRVDAAKQLLIESDLSVNEIARQCGFHDISNFGRTFKKETGCAPRDYRKQHNNAK